ncbi:enoyl-CoA hydratase/isomerase family protein [Shimia sp. R9_1]|uniref:enoyl-CoA hydratase/isomerase family protein n=1 Tax=Shimia sp. R9_1 TaxID=2821111 RepID=UPI001ADC5B75|nr:enoyl-CoA hydratase/isomerase family protein [Shimia sp. R9_1]MBO9409758.1 enoyl-CoA hydratase/isomerase family protein [Shimia sp. R9_1]
MGDFEVSQVNVKKQGRAGIISLNRPEAMNALTLEMIRLIDKALTQFQDDPDIFCVILTSCTERAFCAGGDMRRIRQLVLAGAFDEAEQFFKEEYALIERISEYSKPYISLIDGVCMGGGMGLSVHGNYRIATERALFAMPETMIGFFPDVGGSHFLSRMPNQSGIWMGLTGASVRGFDAHGLGISTHLTVAESLPRLLEELSYGVRDIENILSELCATLGYQPSVLMLSDTTMCFDQPTLCTIFDCLERYQTKPKERALSALKQASPRSLQETLTLVRNGRERSLSECLEHEFEAMQRALRHPDLVEGIRAVLVDKDHSPSWHSRGK